MFGGRFYIFALAMLIKLTDNMFPFPPSTTMNLLELFMNHGHLLMTKSDRDRLRNQIGSSSGVPVPNTQRHELAEMVVEGTQWIMGN